MALESSAKARYLPPASEDTPEIPTKVDNGLKFTENYSIYLKVLKDENLRAAFAAARPGLTQSWLKKELKNATAKNLHKYRESLCSESQIDEIIEKVQAHAKQLGNAKPDAKVIRKWFHKHPELLEFFVEYALDQRMLELEFDVSRAHEEIERIMTANKDKWHDYDILCINEEMKKTQVGRNYRNMLRLVHPDKNKDEDATTCSQIINNAYQRVMGENKDVYEPFQGPRGYCIEDMGRYAPGAHTADSEDSDDENDGAMKNPDKEIPDVPQNIREVHKKVGKHVLSYFTTFVNDNPPFPDEIRKANDEIHKLNEAAKRNLGWYKVDKQVIEVIRQEQLSFIKPQNPIDAEAIENFMRPFRNTSRMRENQWPESWGEAIEKILCIELDEPADKNHPGAFQKTGAAIDIGMDRNTNGNSFQTDSSHGVRGNVMETAVRQIKPLRPGYTLFGDKILGCRESKRFDPFQNSYVTRSVSFFIKNRNSKVFDIVSGAEIGYEAARAYCQLGENEKNDVGIYLNAVSDGTLTRNMYNGILGVCTKKSQFEITHRLPDTWLHIAVTQLDVSKPVIVHRTAFRKLIDNADKRIDSFYMDIGVEPPWFTTRYPDPRNRLQYISKESQHSGNQMATTSSLHHEVESDGNDPVRSRYGRSAIAHKNDGDRFTRAMTEMMLQIKEEAHKERKQLLKQHRKQQRQIEEIKKYMDTQRAIQG